MTNLTNENFSDLSVKFDNTEPHLRCVKQGENSDVMLSNNAQTYTTMMECIQPFIEPVNLLIHFKTSESGREYLYSIPLPVLLTQFLTPATLKMDDFMPRWNAITNPSVVEVPSTLKYNHSLSTPPISLHPLLSPPLLYFILLLFSFFLVFKTIIARLCEHNVVTSYLLIFSLLSFTRVLL